MADSVPVDATPQRYYLVNGLLRSARCTRVGAHPLNWSVGQLTISLTTQPTLTLSACRPLPTTPNSNLPRAYRAASAN
jgi:hypothetical protein